MSKPRRKKQLPKRILALPDLEQSKTAVLNSLASKSGQRTYDRAITDFAIPHRARYGMFRLILYPISARSYSHLARILRAVVRRLAPRL